MSMSMKSMKEKHVYCQSCGMPMTEEAHFGTDKGGTKNEDYCVYCYKEGKFDSDCTMEQMIDLCLDMDTDYEKYGCKDRVEAKAAMMEYFPKLKRWSENQ